METKRKKRVFSNEWRENMSKAHRGSNCYKYHTGTLVTVLEDQKTLYSIGDVSKKWGVGQTGIRRKLKTSPNITVKSKRTGIILHITLFKRG